MPLTVETRSHICRGNDGDPMITVEDLLLDSDLRRFAAQPELDPLAAVDVLYEAQLLDIRCDALRSTLACCSSYARHSSCGQAMSVFLLRMAYAT